MKTKNISLTFMVIICTLININVFAQTFVRYDYDNAGNRILRQVITIPPKLSPEDSLQFIVQHPGLEENLKGAEENLGDCKVTVFPNPTGGIFTLEINGSFDGNSSMLSLYSISGTEISNRRQLAKSNKMDISSYPAGSYILKVSLDGLSASWIIIKE